MGEGLAGALAVSDSSAGNRLCSEARTKKMLRSSPPGLHRNMGGACLVIMNDEADRPIIYLRDVADEPVDRAVPAQSFHKPVYCVVN